MDQAVCGLKIPYTPAALSTRVPFPSETEISVTYGGLDKTPGRGEDRTNSACGVGTNQNKHSIRLYTKCCFPNWCVC